MPGKAAAVVVMERQKLILEQFCRATTITVRLQKRARIILLAFEKQLNRDIAQTVQLGTDQLGLWRTRGVFVLNTCSDIRRRPSLSAFRTISHWWRKRWQENFERLTIIEGSLQSADLKQAVLDLLADEQRSGRPPTFIAEQLTMIFAVACEAVEDSGRPVARWTQREIADEVGKRGIVESISLSHLSTLLAEAQLQPHKSRYWLNTKEADPEVFEQQLRTVCECYQQALELLAQHDTHTVCMDEMTSIQAQPVVVCPERRNC